MTAHDNLAQRIRRRLRVRWLNTRRGIRIAASTYIARSALIQTTCDGRSFGGRIVIAGGVIISDGAIVTTYGGSIEIGADAYIGPYCVLYGHGGLSIGRNTMIGAHTVIIPANHGFERVDVPMSAQPLTSKGIVIGEDVWIGSGCRILDGAHIGGGSVIGAGSVVTKNIDPFSIALGVPARIVGSRQAQ